MEKFNIAVINSAFEKLETLDNRIYFEAKRDGYHYLTTESRM